MLAAFVFDVLHLISGGRPYSLHVFPGTDPGFYPMVWAPFAAMLACGSLLMMEAEKGLKGLLPVYAALSAHLALTVMGQDLFAARAQSAVVLLWAIIFGEGVWSRVLALALALAYYPAESQLAATGAFESLFRLDWLNPLEGPALALDMTLKEAAFQSSGLWGLGPEYLSRLDFVAPGVMRINALPYLAVMSGRGGLLIYASVVLSVLLVMAWLAVKTRSEKGVSSMMPAWLLVASNQYLTLFLFLGWRSVGFTHPPAFVGGAGTGMEILFLGLLSVPLVRSRKNEEEAPEAPEAPGESPDSPSYGRAGGMFPDQGDQGEGQPQGQGQPQGEPDP
jgi:hypothetical protein